MLVNLTWEVTIMKLTSPFSIIRNAISDLKRVPKEKKQKEKSVV